MKDIVRMLQNNGLIFDNEDFQCTVKTLADFYEVGIEAIKTIIKRNRSMFEDEYLVFYPKDIEFKRMVDAEKISRYTSTISVFSLIGILHLSFYIRNKTSLSIQYWLLNNKLNLYNLLNSKSCYNDKIFVKKYEKELGFLLNKIFSKNHIIESQYRVDNYKIDFVIDNKIAVECDEYDHVYYDKYKEKIRERCITDKGFILLRYNTKRNNMLEFIGEVCEQLAKG